MAYTIIRNDKALIVEGGMPIEELEALMQLASRLGFDSFMCQDEKTMFYTGAKEEDFGGNRMAETLVRNLDMPAEIAHDVARLLKENPADRSGTLTPASFKRRRHMSPPTTDLPPVEPIYVRKEASGDNGEDGAVLPEIQAAIDKAREAQQDHDGDEDTTGG